MPNTLYYGDNLDVLRRYFSDECVDLIYLDPPFNSNRDYNVLFRDQSGEGSPAQIKAFEDTWNWAGAAEVWDDFPATCPSPKVIDLMAGFINTLGKNSVTAYLVMMAPRLFELRRVLKKTGSLYLHCDPTASHYLKLTLDCLFGPANFRNEVIWKRTHSHGGSRRYGPIHDVILFYSKTDAYIWKPQHTAYSADYRDKFFRQSDGTGKRYQSVILTGSGKRGGSSGRPWREYDPTTIGRHWAVPGYVRDLIGETADVQSALDELDRIGRVIWPRDGDGAPRFKQYVDDMPGVALQDIFTDIPPIPAQASERLGYPTQKPQALLERIISASSHTDDIVLDPFCGCGTAIAASQKLGRSWIGIDITPIATSLIQKRLWDQFEAKDRRRLTKDDSPTVHARAFDVVGLPVDTDGARTLFRADHKNFEMWAVGLVPAIPQEKKGADQGIDGVAYFHDGSKKPQKAIVQVKGGHVGSNLIRDLRGTKEREGAALALFICLEQPTAAMRKEALEAGFYQAPAGGKKVEALQILTIGELLASKRFMLPFTGVNVSYLRTASEGDTSQTALDLTS